MPDPLYLIQLCPRALRPAVGDRISVSIAERQAGQALGTEIHLGSGVALPCERMTRDTAGVLVRFPPQPIAGTVSEVAPAPPRPGGADAARLFEADGLLPEDVLITVHADRTGRA